MRPAAGVSLNTRYVRRADRPDILAIVDLAHPYDDAQTVPITAMRNALAQSERIDHVIAFSRQVHPAAARAVAAADLGH